MSFYEWYLSRMKINWSQVAKREDFSCFFFSRQWKEFVILNKEFILKFTTITLSLLMRVSPWFGVNVLCLWPRKLVLVNFPLEINEREHFLWSCTTVHFGLFGRANRPFPSSLVPLSQNESKCETFHVKMSSAKAIAETWEDWERVWLFSFIWKTKIFKWKINQIWECPQRIEVFNGGKWQNGSSSNIT